MIPVTYAYARIRKSDHVTHNRFSRNFDKGVRVQPELTKQNIGIVAMNEDINTADATPRRSSTTGS